MTRFGGFFDSRDEDTVSVSDGFGRIGEGRRVRRPDPFGRVLPDERFDDFRKAWKRDRDPVSLFGERPFALDGGVGADADNRRADVARLETGLGFLGHLDLDRTEGPTGYPGTRLVEATKAFQRENNLKVDGLVTPGGPTIRTLERRIGDGRPRLGTMEHRAGEGPPARIDTLAGTGRTGNLLERAAAADHAESEGKSPSGSSGEVETAGAKLIFDAIRGLWVLGTKGGRTSPRVPPPPPPIPQQERGMGTDGPSPPSREKPDKSSSDHAARREAVADDFLKQVMKPLESHRGDETTQKGNNIVAQECRNVLNEDYPDIADRIDHVAGADRDGDGVSLPERRVQRPGKEPEAAGSSYPDLTWEDKRKGRDDPSRRAHANTMTQGKRGNYTTRENRSFDSLEDKVGGDLATKIPKLRPGMDEDEYRKTAKEKCREIFGKWLGKPSKDEEGE